MRKVFDYVKNEAIITFELALHYISHKGILLNFINIINYFCNIETKILWNFEKDKLRFYKLHNLRFSNRTTYCAYFNVNPVRFYDDCNLFPKSRNFQI